MNESLRPHEAMDDTWFRVNSLALLKEQLARQTYPGYPTQEERFWSRNVAWFIDPILLPVRGCETSEGTFPTAVEREELADKDLRFDAFGRPLHPWFMAMVTDPEIGVVTGKGFYWNWGPNYTADPIVVRYDLGEPHVLLIERMDGTGWALPGGFVNPGEEGIVAASREAEEETGLVLQKFNPTHEITYTGPLADLRVTANAWPETTAVRFDIPNEEAGNLPNGMWQGGDDARTAGWFPASELDTRLFGSHVLLIKQALGQA